jgi:phage baseplate assembly protein W
MPYKSIELTNAAATTVQAVKKSNFYIGFSTLDANNTGSKLYDLDLIKQDIINQFNTKKGSRVMNPTFGSDIWDLLMEPISDSVRTAIVNDVTAVCTADPRATPTQMDLTEYPNGYVLELTLVLNSTNQASSIRLQFDQNIGLTIQTQ